jgi:hypothetical protein
MVAHQNTCNSAPQGCQFNSKLLQYFIQKEFVEKKEQGQPDPVPEPEVSAPVVTKEATVEEKDTEEHSHCCSANAEDI